MPISSQTPIIGYVANGVSTAFTFPFVILSADDLKVSVNNALVTTGLSITGVGDRDGGTVTFSAPPAASAPIILYREVSLERTTDYQENGDLLAGVLDDDLDRLWAALQDQAVIGSQALRVPVGETVTSLPKASERAMKALGFDSLGRPIALPQYDASSLAIALQNATPSNDGAALVGVDDGSGGSLFSTVKGFILKLLSFDGLTLLKYDEEDPQTVEEVLDSAKPMANYTALRAYTGRATGVRITQAGLAGHFFRAASDTTSADNGGTIIVDGAGRRWKRIYDGIIHVEWFGADPTGIADSRSAFQAALNAVPQQSGTFDIQSERRGAEVKFGPGRFRLTGGVSGHAGTKISGAGRNATVLVHEGATGDVISFIGVENGTIDPVEIEGLAVVQASGFPHASGHAIKIDGNSFGTSILLRNIFTYGTAGGIYLDWVFPGTLENVHAFVHENGFLTRLNTTSLSFQNCYAGACTGSGFKLAGFYHSLMACASDSNALDGYEVYYDGGAAAGISLIACGSELFGRNGISTDRINGTTITSPRLIAASGASSAFKFDAGDSITVMSPVPSSSFANANAVFNISNASGAYPSNVVILGWSGTLVGYASTINNPDYVFWIGSRTSFGANGDSFRLGGIGNFNRALQTFQIGANFPAGSVGTVYSANYVPVVASPYSLAAAARYKPVVNASGETIARLISGPFVEAPTVTAGTVTRHEGVRVADMPAGSSADAGLVLGDSAVPVGRWSLCNTSSRAALQVPPTRWGSATGPIDAYGAGSPEGVLIAPVGSTYRRTDGGAGTSFYVKESGAGNTGWIAK